MAGSSPDRTHDLNLDSLGSPDAPHREHYGDVSGPLRSSTALSIPEAESSDEIEELETGDPYPARGLPNLDFTPTHEGSLLGSIHTRIAALRSTTADAQVRYSRAINSSIPQDPVINKNLRMTVANTLWNSTAFFEEEEAAAQLLRYREMFIYLSQRHAESLAESSLYQAQYLVRRGQISVAAIRLAGSQPRSNTDHSVAQGHHARHSSEVSILGWKPWREIALAEEVSERRRQKVEREREREREKRKEKFLRGKGVEFLGNFTNPGLGEAFGKDITPPSTKTRVWRRRTHRKTTTGRIRLIRKEVHYSDGGSTDKEHSTNDDPINTSSSDSGRVSLSGSRPPTDGATSREGLISFPDMLIPNDPGPPGWAWSTRPGNKIIWRIPVYHDISPSSLATSPPPDRRSGLTIPTIVTASNGNDMFQRIHTISEPSGMGYTASWSSSLGPALSPQISPKSQASPNLSSENDTSTVSTDERSLIPPPETIASLSQQSSVLFTNVFERRNRSAAEPNDSSSDSTVGVSRSREHLQRVKTVLKSFSLKNVHFPWSSSSEEETQTSAHSSNDPSISEKSWPLNGIPSDYGLIPPPTQQKYYLYTEYLDEPTPQTRIHSPHTHSPQVKIPRKKVPVTSHHSPPHPGTKMTPNMKSLPNTTVESEHVPTIRHQESDPLTRTEKEYQEILSTLNELKRDMRVGKGKITRSDE